MPSDRSAHPPRRRDRHGRGLRRPLAPHGVPLARTRAEIFEDLVLDAIEDLEQVLDGGSAAELAGVEFAVEDVPELPNRGRASEFDPDLVVDHGVPLARLYRNGMASGAARKPVIVVYRRPLEARTLDRGERADLVYAVIAELLAEYLGHDVDN